MTRTRAALVGIAAATCTLAALGLSLSGAAQATSRPPSTVTVTRADGGNTYRLPRGDHLDVALNGPSGFTWSEPSASSGRVLHRTSGSAGATATADFTAAARGKVTVVAGGSPQCTTGKVCPTVLMAFEVTVRVVR